jgi:hypothetical protein
MEMETKTITVPASRYEGFDDSLSAAEEAAREDLGLAGWDLSPRWADEERERINLTIPAWVRAR